MNIKVISFLFISLLFSGCAGFDKMPSETVIDKATTGTVDNKIISQITDANVVLYANEIKGFMDKRMNQKRVLRKISSGIQVMTAAIATALAGFEASSQIIAGFAGVSALIPELQSLIQAKEGADAFREGTKLIDDAITGYFSAGNGAINTNQLTQQGAVLWSTTKASIHLVYKALLQQIPTLDEVMAATTEPT